MGLGNEYSISGDKAKLDMARISEMLKSSYWAKERSRTAIRRSIDNSLCFGVYKDGEQVGFARAVTDYATVFWLCDVIIDEKHRGRGLGKALVEYIVNSDELAGLRGILATKDAHGLYEQYGFARNADNYMAKPAQP
jgi:GNAT superfamily N-acetyltransferase